MKAEIGMNRRRLVLLSVTFLLLCSINGCDHPRRSSAATSPAVTNIGSTGPKIILPDGFAVAVEVAADDSTREQGLMFRDHLSSDRGMIFMFPSTSEYSFWMKNTLIPLDMVWIDDQRRVVHVKSDVPPCQADPCPSYPPNTPSRYVLELAAGSAVKHRVTAGVHLRFAGLDAVAPR